MTLLDLALFYLLLGAGACLLMAKRGRRTPADLALALVLWPVIAPVALSASEGAAPPRREALPDFEALLEALRTVRDARVAPLLPTPEQLAPLRTHLEELGGKLAELQEVLAQGEFSAIEDPEVRASRARLVALRDEALKEQRALLALCRRLRAQILVLRFSGASAGDVKELTAELLGRVAGAQAALDPSS
jgi:hypothetical protein